MLHILYEFKSYAGSISEVRRGSELSRKVKLQHFEFCTMAVSTFLHILLVGLAGIILASQILLTDYLESVGAAWYNILMIQYWIGTICSICYWILESFFDYYFDERKRHETHDKYSNFCFYLLSIFPTSLKPWLVLIFRSVFHLGYLALLDFALVHTDSGDTLLVLTVFLIFTNFLCNSCIFGESLKLLTVISVLLCIAGIIMVAQPSFLFSSYDDYSTVNGVAFGVVLCSAICRAIEIAGVKFIMGKDTGRKMRQTTVIVLPLVISSIILILVYISNGSWNVWIISNTSSNTNLDKFLLIFLGFLFFVWTLLKNSVTLKSYGLGSVGIDIIIPYILGAIALNDIENNICYIGVALTVVACIIVFYQEHKQVKENDEAAGYENVPGDVEYDWRYAVV